MRASVHMRKCVSRAAEMRQYICGNASVDLRSIVSTYADEICVSTYADICSQVDYSGSAKTLRLRAAVRSIHAWTDGGQGRR